jgi:putative cardiolipin synthase
LPESAHRAPSFAYTDTADTAFGRESAVLINDHPGESGFYPLANGLDALVARIVLAEHAERSLDVQYYIWHGDTTGNALVHYLLQAAERGVRVRLLLDDLSAGQYDHYLLLLDKHPNLEIRLFNPFAMRQARNLEFLTRFSRINRRMHNKSFTADNQMTIVGGRNVGDEYFAARSDLDFADLDVLAMGPVVEKTSAAFDLYWNSEFAYPVASLDVTAADNMTLADLQDYYAKHIESLKDSAYVEALRNSDLAQRLERGDLELFWGEAELVYDMPEKIAVSPNDRTTHLEPQLAPIADSVKKDLFIISPYFVPGDEGVAFFRSLVKEGVRVRILTNSLASNDVGIVHAGYARYRPALLKAGVELYEARPSPNRKEKKTASGVTGSSRASLHAKAFVFDRRYVFIGSLNLDPRSSRLNTEIGVIFESPELADLMIDGFMEKAADVAYQVTIESVPSDDVGAFDTYQLRWKTKKDGEVVTLTSEPYASIWKQMLLALLSVLPIESQL